MTSIDLTSNPFNLNQKQCEWVINTLDNMSVEQKIGQLFVVNTHGNKKEISQLLEHQIGGIFLHMHFKSHQYNVCKKLQSETKIPMIIAGDLEMG
ncbi:MAG: hypothetical protein GY870_06180, partial [archaeon]|nr:hypothetical protein [archaeon]